MGALRGFVITLIDMLYNFTGNYGVSIILLTIIVRLIVLPFNIKSMQFAHVSKELNPRMEELKKKYKDDKEKLNQATVELWQEYKVNPAAGCLPMLIQFPILIAVITAMQLPEFYKVAEPLFLSLNLALPESGVYAWNLGLQYMILPLLSVITTYASSKVMAAGNDQGSMKSMNIFMTLMMGWICLRFPSGIALYWVVGNLFSITQYLVFNRMMANKSLTNEIAEGADKREKRSKKR